MITAAQTKILIANRNTVSAGRLTLWLARFFGRKELLKDGEWTVLVRHWRGTPYTIHFETHPEASA
ncbi:hypothetical protein [Roseobacter sp. S98]|uniref:hypothetical protein n=1 Tax=Roseobacter algicola (ex Choi et al. 2025) (nom. illeg.) TaxID=3092138 RepID=UPI0035C7108B